MGTATITLDDRAFQTESTSRVQQRGQRIIRGTIAGSSSYSAGGDSADLSSYFPSGKYRVVLNALSNTGVHLGVYDHNSKKIKIYSALNTEATGNLQTAVFNFIAVGE